MSGFHTVRGIWNSQIFPLNQMLASVSVTFVSQMAELPEYKFIHKFNSMFSLKKQTF